MVDLQPVDRFQFKRHQQVDRSEADMADEPEDPDAAADRLEAALERIARLTAAPPAGTPSSAAPSDLSVPEITERLDSLIERLRAALGKSD
jgi:hypothetical protein